MRLYEPKRGDKTRVLTKQLKGMYHIVKNIYGIAAVDDGRMVIFFIDGSRIETDSITLNYAAHL